MKSLQNHRCRYIANYIYKCTKLDNKIQNDRVVYLIDFCLPNSLLESFHSSFRFGIFQRARNIGYDKHEYEHCYYIHLIVTDTILHVKRPKSNKARYNLVKVSFIHIMVIFYRGYSQTEPGDLEGGLSLITNILQSHIVWRF